jgi:hypothetical protein
MIIYDFRLNQKPLTEKWTLNEMESNIERLVTDPRRLTHEVLQLESYIFSPEITKPPPLDESVVEEKIATDWY